jgi:hypothetical protein
MGMGLDLELLQLSLVLLLLQEIARGALISAESGTLPSPSGSGLNRDGMTSGILMTILLAKLVSQTELRQRHSDLALCFAG